MKKRISWYLAFHTVVIVLFCVFASILLYRKHTKIAAPDHGKPVVYYLSDQLHLASIPDGIVQEHNAGKVSIDKAALRAAFPTPLALGQAKFTAMSFIVPGVSGLNDPTTYFASHPLNRMDDNIVHVWNIAPWSKEDYAHNPPGARDRRMTWARTGDYWQKHPPKEMYGMQCYDPGKSKSCLGEILPGEWARVEIDDLPDFTKSPNALRPLMQVSYFTKSYGGLTIQWNTHAKHAAKWREIDAKFWQQMQEHNLLERPQSATTNN